MLGSLRTVINHSVGDGVGNGSPGNTLNVPRAKVMGEVPDPGAPPSGNEPIAAHDVSVAKQAAASFGISRSRAVNAPSGLSPASIDAPDPAMQTLLGDPEFTRGLIMRLFGSTSIYHTDSR
jgi:hypothetical protein